MEYVHPCGNLNKLQTLENAAIENPLQCIYNDIIDKKYICPKEECPNRCARNYHKIKMQIMEIKNDIEDLEQLVKQA
jgi:hypothetical protein